MRMGEVPLGYTEAAWEKYPDQVQPADSNGSLALFDSDGPGFGDLLDAINPLQHIPVISSIYREVTGDDIGAAARVIGGTLYGGPVGLAAAIVNVALEETSGKDIGENMIAALFGDETTAADGDAPVALAAADETAAARDADKTAAAQRLTASAGPSAPVAPESAVAVPWVNPDSLPLDPEGGRAAIDAALAEAQAMAAMISPAAGDSTARNPNRHPEAPGRPIDRVDQVDPETRTRRAAQPAAPVAPAAPAAAGNTAPAENPLSDPMAGGIAASMLGALEQYERLVRDRQGAGRTVDIDS